MNEKYAYFLGIKHDEKGDEKGNKKLSKICASNLQNNKFIF